MDIECTRNVVRVRKVGVRMRFPVIDPIATGERIKELRVQNHLKVVDICNFMGFESEQAVYKWQSGKSLPTVDNLYALSELFGTSIDDILVGSRKEELEYERAC